MRILRLAIAVYLLKDVHQQKNAVAKKEPRNLEVTVIAGVLAFIFAAITVFVLTDSQGMWGYGFVFGPLAVISLGVAMSGRKSLFAIMAELFFWIP